MAVLDGLLTLVVYASLAMLGLVIPALVLRWALPINGIIRELHGIRKALEKRSEAPWHVG
jgi:hypothetical protein